MERSVPRAAAVVAALLMMVVSCSAWTRRQSQRKMAGAQGDLKRR